MRYVAARLFACPACHVEVHQTRAGYDRVVPRAYGETSYGYRSLCALVSACRQEDEERAEIGGSPCGCICRWEAARWEAAGICAYCLVEPATEMTRSLPACVWCAAALREDRPSVESVRDEIAQMGLGECESSPSIPLIVPARPRQRLGRAS
jgi:hypothetical protein